MTAEHGKKPENDARSSENRESDGNTADADPNRVVAVDVECLCGCHTNISVTLSNFSREAKLTPEHDDREEVGSRDEGDDEREAQDARILSQTLGKHRILRPERFPEEEADQHGGSENERDEHMCASPAVLVSAPLHSLCCIS